MSAIFSLELTVSQDRGPLVRLRPEQVQRVVNAWRAEACGDFQDAGAEALRRKLHRAVDAVVDQMVMELR